MDGVKDAEGERHDYLPHFLCVWGGGGIGERGGLDAVEPRKTEAAGDVSVCGGGAV